MEQLSNVITLILGISVLSIPAILISYFIFRHKLKKVKEVVKNEIKGEVLNGLKQEIDNLEGTRLTRENELEELSEKIQREQETFLTEVNRLNKIKQDILSYEEEIKKYGDSFSIQEKISIQKEKLKKLISEVSKYESILHMQEYGLYTPYFSFDTSEQYKQKILELRNAQKELIQNNLACICSTPWTVDGSRSKGLAMEKDAIKLAIRSFNNECDAIIAKVTFKNVEQSIERMRKSFDQINKLNSRNAVSLQYSYFELKVKELQATYEYAVKKEDERAEQQRIKDEMREELKAQKELEKARLEAEKQQREYQKELEYTKKLLAKDAKNQELQEKLSKLEISLQEAIKNGQRAISQAQLTKSGHVYVISNIGSFGENVYKIGMTRRLEPLDRIRELGDASVPFSFDVHAMIYSEDAPNLERELHRLFADKQLNRINPRKEFFKVSLEEIKTVTEKLGFKIEYTMLAEAKEYFESLALEKEGKYSSLSTDELMDEDEIDKLIDSL